MACIKIGHWGELWQALEELEMSKNVRSEENKSVRGEKAMSEKDSMKSGRKKMDEKIAKKAVGKRK